MNIDPAVAAAAATPGADVRRACGRAVVRGVHNTRSNARSGVRVRHAAAADTEHAATAGPRALRAPAVRRQRRAQRGPSSAPVGHAVSDVAAGALRLAHRALETHGRAVQDHTVAWIDRALQRAARALTDVALDADAGVPIVIEQARRATVALTRATAATADDPMLVPEQVATGLAHLLAVHRIATEAAGS